MFSKRYAIAALFGAAVVFAACWKISPYNVPLALALYFLAIACRYDLQYLAVPWWIPIAMGALGVAYYLALWAGALVAPSELVDMLNGLDFLLPVVGALGLAWGAVVALGVAVVCIPSFGGIGDADLALIAALGALIPAREIPNIPGLSPLFLPSVALNTVIAGTGFACAIWLAYVALRRFRMASPERHGRFWMPERRYPERLRREKAARGIYGTLCVVGFWLVLGHLFPRFPPSLTPGSAIALGLVWIAIFAVSLTLYSIAPFPVGFVNALLVLCYVPGFIPPFSDVMYVIIPVLLLSVLIEAMLVVRDVIELCLPQVRIMDTGFPYAPAILFGLLLTSFWGDFLVGWFCPHAIPWMAHLT